MTRYFTLLFFAFGLNFSFGQSTQAFFDKADSFLKANVSEGKVDDERIHFVLVCGVVGCPPLINSAFSQV
ncbi:DUF547 domain-containing protein [Sediminibacter sp. Hel_I_10]|uniref:DUF547 domain-containing protein n=1 Tax=Sediminibacter sp. Hel_I_10 TaxID=1392490 RepID=UPI00047AA955|nr:DUF547 domain-containing protein [Sediminibacter sp. Hel_I_10]